jgi:hypothetical protein
MDSIMKIKTRAYIVGAQAFLEVICCECKSAIKKCVFQFKDIPDLQDKDLCSECISKYIEYSHPQGSLKVYNIMVVNIDERLKK